jgi:hypothetical protein
MTAVAEAPERLPPVTVDCTACECQFVSRARRHQRVRCPRCGHSVRVKRADIPVDGERGGQAPGAVPDASAPRWAPAPGTGRLDALAWLRPSAASAPAAIVAAPRGDRTAPAAAQPGMTWAAALAALGWRLAPVSGKCQVKERALVCDQESSRRITGALAAVISRATRI